MTKKNTILRGIFSAETIDRAGELVSIKGMDISSLTSGRGLANAEHSNSFASTVGKIISAKKIFTEKDCDNNYERRLFKTCNGAALLIGSIELFDGEEDHPEANAIAKIAKYYKNRDLPINLGLSVEGGVLARDGNTITRSIVRKVAITASAANEAATLELGNELSKSEFSVYDKLSKSTPSKDVLSTGQIHEVIEIDENAISDRLVVIKDRLSSLIKGLEAGFACGAPGSLTQGAALQRGSRSKPKKLKKEESSKSLNEEDSEKTTIVEGLKPIDKEKAEKIDSKKEEATLDLKLKKAQIIAYSFFSKKK